MTAKKSFVFNFAQPSYMNDNNNPSLEDTTTDPIFKVTSKKPYRPEVTTRSTTWDYFRTSLLLPSASEVLNALGRGIEEIDQLLCDGRVKACFNNRRAGTMSLKWTIDRNNAPSRMFKVIDKMFQQLPVQDIMSEMLLASFYGYAVSEVIWEYDGGLWLPTNVTGKPVRWFGWSELNELRYKTKVQMVQGEPLPPRKFLATRFHATYGDPASSREALFNGCYWPVKFRHMVLEYGIRFLEKYGSPWLDVKMETGLQEERLNEILTVLQNTFQDGIVAHPDNTEITALAVGDSKSVQNYIDWMDILNREIDMCILGNNMSAEIKGGSYAAATALAGVRDDIIKEDCRMVETSMNQLIEWICWYNWPATTDLPKFRLYKSEPPTKERADIDTALKAMGVTFKKEYFTRTYGLDEEEFDLAEPVQMQTVVGPDGLPKQVPMPGAAIGPDGQLAASTTQTITDEGIETKDVSSNSQTKQAIAKSQSKGSNYAEVKKNFGGEGSGNFDHEGRPGEVGGSGEGGGGESKEITERRQILATAKKEHARMPPGEMKNLVGAEIEKEEKALANKPEAKTEPKTEAKAVAVSKKTAEDIQKEIDILQPQVQQAQKESLDLFKDRTPETINKNQEAQRKTEELTKKISALKVERDNLFKTAIREKMALKSLPELEKEQETMRLAINKAIRSRDPAMKQLQTEYDTVKEIVKERIKSGEKIAKEVVAEKRVAAHSAIDQTNKGKSSDYFVEKSSKMSAHEIHQSLSGKGIENNIVTKVEKGTLSIDGARGLHASIEQNMADYGPRYVEAVSKIVVEDGEKALGRKCGGLYNSADRTIHLTTSWDQSEPPQTIGGLPHIVTKLTTNTTLGNMKGVMDHETGHAMHDLLKENPTRSFKSIANKLSSYASKDKGEMYAELFTAGRNGQISDTQVLAEYHKFDKAIRGE